MTFMVASGLAAALWTVVVLAAQSTPAPDLLRSAADPNPALRSYTATASLSAELQAPIPIRKTFAGTLYYLKPDEKIVFENVTGPLSRFKELDTKLPSYQEMTTDYKITPTTDDGTLATYVLAPTAPGRRVQRLTLSVDERLRQIVRAVWSYAGGGSMTIEPAYGAVDGFQLPVEERMTARFPSYNVDAVLKLSDYHLGVPIPQSMFTGD